MSGPRPAVGTPSASGVRRGGDHYQDLVVWLSAMLLIRPDKPYTSLDVEINGVGNLDDAVLRSPDEDQFTQVKWSPNAASQVDEHFLTTASDGGRSLLQKLFDSYHLVTALGGPRPAMQLLTNRTIDPAHPLLSHLDGRTQLLVPYVGNATPRSATGKAIARWASHVGSSREDLLEMLEHLQFMTSRSVPDLVERTELLMLVNGLKNDVGAVDLGANQAFRWVRDGQRTIAPKDIHAVIDQLDLRRGPVRAVLSVQAIDVDPISGDATETVNWIDLYEGSSPALRRRPADPRSWARMQGDLNAAAARLDAGGWRHVLCHGFARQATWVAVGAALPGVRGYELSMVQNGRLWTTDADPAAITCLQQRAAPLQQGADLAVVAEVSARATTAVESFVREAGLPIGHLLTLTPGAGASDRSIHGDGEAVAVSTSVRDAVRVHLEQHPGTARIHLFLAGPATLALFLGHRWNALRPTTVYEHIGAGLGYAAAFNIDA